MSTANYGPLNQPWLKDKLFPLIYQPIFYGVNVRREYWYIIVFAILSILSAI